MRVTQRELVLELLDDGGWHSTIEFVDLGIIRVGSRVWELRCGGYPIQCRRRSGGRGRSKAIFEYRLEAGAPLPLASAPTRRSSRVVVCPACGTPKRVTTISAGLAYLSCGLHFVSVAELGESVA